MKTRRALGLTGCKPNFKYSEKPFLKRVNERVDRMRYQSPLHLHIRVCTSICTHTHTPYTIHLYHLTYTRERDRQTDIEGAELKFYVQKVARGLDNRSKQFNLSTEACPMGAEMKDKPKKQASIKS